MITFNNRQLPDWVNVVGLDFQTSSLSLLEYEAKRRVGNFDAGIDRGGVNINLDLFIEPVKGLSIFEQADELKRFVRGNNWEVSQLILDEQPNKFYNARVSDAGEITDNFTHGDNSITFYCADPKKYDVSMSATAKASGEVAINYEGLEETALAAEIEFTQDTINPVIKNVENSQEIALKGNFSTGDLLVVDTDKRTIHLNGDNIKSKMMFKSNWLTLTEGINTIQITNADGLMNNITVKFRRAD